MHDNGLEKEKNAKEGMKRKSRKRFSRQTIDMPLKEGILGICYILSPNRTNKMYIFTKHSSDILPIPSPLQAKDLN